MRASVWTWLFTSAVFIAALALTACGQKKDDSTSAINGQTRSSGVVSGPTNPQGYIKGSGVYLTAASYGTGGLSNTQFENGVADFISAAWDASRGLGPISDQSVVVQGYLEMANATQFNLAVSNLNIRITDDFARDGVKMDNGQIAQPFSVSFASATSGMINGNQFSIVFKDDFQEVTLAGTMSGAGTYGTLSFRNFKDAAGGQLKSASPMGYFAIMTCALLNCKKQ